MAEAAGAQGRLRLIVLSSTYPRWQDDPEPAFVHELARRLTSTFDVMGICPHAAGAAFAEVLDGVGVHRYRYAPDRWETLVNGGGILTNLQRKPWKWLLVPTFMFAQWWAVRAAIRRDRPHVLHAHWLLPQGLVVAHGSGALPVLATSHGADLFGLRGRIFAGLRKHVVSRMTAVAVVSEAMRQRVLAEISSKQVYVLPMGVECDQQFIPGKGDRDQYALLFVGRLVEKKGVRHLVEAMPAILQTFDQTSLTIIGSGPELNNLRRRAAELGLDGKVIFLGGLPQERLPKYYQQASLFIAPFVEAGGGDQEGLGLVVAEAMACGCPVLVGDVPGVRDLVDNTTGVRISGKDSAALAEAVVALLKDPTRRAQLATTARARVVERYAWSVVAQKYAALLKTLAEGATHE